MLYNYIYIYIYIYQTQDGSQTTSMPVNTSEISKSVYTDHKSNEEVCKYCKIVSAT